MDELVAYIRQFEEGKSFTGGSYGSNLSFVQALTEALKAVPNAALLASLPESDKEAGSGQGISALRTLEHYFARVQALWKPVATEEAFEIVRRRMFSTIQDKAGAENVCRAYADYYVANSSEVPHETQESRYFERLMQAYPIHPEVFDRLYEDWSSLDSFQRTRGVLKLMAKVIHRLWKDGNNDLMIMPGSLPLYDADTRNEAIYTLPQGWDPVLERDIDGERAETTTIESQDTRLGAVQACRRAARTIFLGSAPASYAGGTPTLLVRGLEIERVILGCVQPGQQVGVFKDGLRRLTDRLHYLNSVNNRFWFDTRPNLRREMEERKRRFQDKEDLFPAIRALVQKSLAQGVFAGVHVFTPGGDVPDDWSLRLVVLLPDAPFSRVEERFWRPAAEGILKNRGDQPRQKQNRLIFLAADYDSLGRLKEQARSMLAWQSIVNDYRENRIVLDNLMAKNAEATLTQAKVALPRMMRETYKWLLAPVQEARPGKGISDIQWENFQINPGAQHFTQEIERVLKDNELLITEWAPIHLAHMLSTWFWKEDIKDIGALDVWRKTCCYLYLPRLKDDEVFRLTLAAGAGSEDFFGFAYGKGDSKYVGFNFGKASAPIMDAALLIIEPATAAAYAEAERAAKEAANATPAAQPTQTTEDGGVHIPGTEEPTKPLPQTSTITPPPLPEAKKRFYGAIELDPFKAKTQFADLVDEVVLHFTSRPGVKVSISIEIQAESPAGFEDGVQRAVKENCNVLRFKNAEFET